MSRSRVGMLSRAFLTGLAFLGPLLLTGIVLAWIFAQLIAFVGPDSVIGHLLSAGGRLLVGARVDPLLSFAVGLLVVVAVVTAIGFAVQNRLRRVLEGWIDEWLGRVPLIGRIYRPVAQLLRSMGGSNAGEMSAMDVCRIEFGGGVETIAFLASPEVFDIGSGPARLVLIPTAPVPVGGALLMVAAHKVHPIPEMKFDDIARLYLTMGMTPPPQLRRSHR